VDKRRCLPGQRGRGGARALDGTVGAPRDEVMDKPGRGSRWSDRGEGAAAYGLVHLPDARDQPGNPATAQPAQGANLRWRH
jgi:hypothetical protein